MVAALGSAVSRRYRDIAAWRLGRPLEAWEVVHHIDGHHADDHPDNLAVLSGPRAHALLHWYQRREARGVQHLWPLETWLELHHYDPSKPQPTPGEQNEQTLTNPRSGGR